MATPSRPSIPSIPRSHSNSVYSASSHSTVMGSDGEKYMRPSERFSRKGDFSDLATKYSAPEPSPRSNAPHQRPPSPDKQRRPLPPPPIPKEPSPPTKRSLFGLKTSSTPSRSHHTPPQSPTKPRNSPATPLHPDSDHSWEFINQSSFQHENTSPTKSKTSKSPKKSSLTSPFSTPTTSRPATRTDSMQTTPQNALPPRQDSFKSPPFYAAGNRLSQTIADEKPNAPNGIIYDFKQQQPSRKLFASRSPTKSPTKSRPQPQPPSRSSQPPSPAQAPPSPIFAQQYASSAPRRQSFSPSNYPSSPDTSRPTSPPVPHQAVMAGYSPPPQERERSRASRAPREPFRGSPVPSPTKERRHGHASDPPAGFNNRAPRSESLHRSAEPAHRTQRQSSASSLVQPQPRSPMSLKEAMNAPDALMNALELNPPTPSYASAPPIRPILSMPSPIHASPDSQPPSAAQSFRSFRSSPAGSISATSFRSSPSLPPSRSQGLEWASYQDKRKRDSDMLALNNYDMHRHSVFTETIPRSFSQHAQKEESMWPESPANFALQEYFDPNGYRPRLVYALTAHPAILANILSYLNYRDFRKLREVNKPLRKALSGNTAAREAVLSRYLHKIGYKPLFMGDGDGKSRPYSNDATGLFEITLRDLDAFQVGLQFNTSDYSSLAKEHLEAPLSPSVLRMIRAATRSYNRLLMRIKNQDAMLAAESADFEPDLRGVTAPIWKYARAPVFRVWVPTQRNWMSDEELVECERECWRSGIWNLLKRGDLVWNAAVSDFGNEGKVIYDGKFLRDLAFKYDAIGHLPSFLNSFAFPPSYYHNILASTSSNPVFYGNLSTFLPQIKGSLMLHKENVETMGHRMQRYVYRANCFIKAHTIIGTEPGIGNGPGGLDIAHADWTGVLMLETEGTPEYADDLLRRCAETNTNATDKLNSNTSPLHPWRVLRDRSRPGEIWIRPIYEDERVN